MPQKLPNINCQCYRNGNCLHHAAPTRWFGKTRCVLLEAPKDPRTNPGCALQYEYPRSSAPLRPPPARVIRDGVSYDTLMPQNGIGKPTEAAGGFVRQGNDVVTCVGCQSMLIRGLNGECKQCGCYWLKNEPLPPNAVKT